MLKKEELMDCIETVYSYSKKLLAMWDDYSKQHIRLHNANLRRIEEFRQHSIEEMDQRRTLRYKLQKQRQYETWKNSPDYDPAKDRNIKKQE